MFSYITLGTTDPERAAHFYDAVLGVLGHHRCDTTGEGDWDDWIGWGIYEDEGRIERALWVCKPFDQARASPGNGVMIAFHASDWRQVRAFHRAALEHGGECQGPPGLRPWYNDDFYAAYVCDPDGNKLAAVCRGFTTEQESESQAPRPRAAQSKQNR
jgi:catechol 2,3-dioxygenase-like lactoylglutathione lyase family enzyme